MSNSRRPEGSRSWLRPALAGGVLLLALVPIVVALLINGGNGPGPGPSAAASVFTPVAAAKPSSAHRSRLGGPGRGAVVAVVRDVTKMRSRPWGPTIATVGTRTGFGSPQAVWVVRRSGGWLGVISPQAGNGHVGWIPAADTTLGRVNWELEVSLSARRLTVLHDGRTLERYTVAIGQPGAPTPTGRFAVTDRLRTGDPSGPYGCCILALSAKAPHAIQDWSGGNRIAIHSTPETSTIGEPVSHGCLRLTLAEGRWLLNHIPLGTPTLISS